MSKIEELIIKLKPIINYTNELELFLVENSNLPGKRGNIELALALAEIYRNTNVLLKWLEITCDQADDNNPGSFLPFCAVTCSGKIYTVTKDPVLITILKQAANDSRWRIREADAFGFQFIGENNFENLKTIFSGWINSANYLEKRAILASLAHPKFLDENKAVYCFNIAEIILNELNNNEKNFDVLKKGLEYTISVFAAANPEYGFEFIEKWIGKNKIINKIMAKNLTKKRLVKINPEKTEKLIYTCKTGLS